MPVLREHDGHRLPGGHRGAASANSLRKDERDAPGRTWGHVLGEITGGSPTMSDEYTLVDAVVDDDERMENDEDECFGDAGNSDEKANLLQSRT